MEKSNDSHITLNYNDEAFFTMFLWKNAFFPVCFYFSQKYFFFSPLFVLTARNVKTTWEENAARDEHKLTRNTHPFIFGYLR